MTKFIKKSFVISILFGGMLITGCKDTSSEIEPILEEPNIIQDELELLEEPSEITVLGDQLENAYSVENMKKAFEELQNDALLKSTSTDLSNFEISTTHLYVRFLPKDSLELDILEQDSLILFDYPLDYEIEEGGMYYHDPSIPEDEITWQYTTVDANYQFPNVSYEILQECFIFDDEVPDEEDALKSTSPNLDIWDALEDKSMQMTNNLTQQEIEQSQLKWWKKYQRPTGYVKVWDTEKRKYVGVEGIKMRVHRLVKISYGTTNKDGKYSTSKKFKYNCFYGLRFENKIGFKLWNWWTSLTPARYSLGVTSPKGKSVNFSTGASKGWRLSTVNNATVDYYNNICPSNGITKPYSDLRIAVIENRSSSSAPMLRRTYHPYGYNSSNGWKNFFINMGISTSANLISYATKYLQPDVTIGASNKNSASVYNSVIHELAHASHFRKVGSRFWAKYVSYIITYDSYGDGSGKNAELCALGEMWGYHMGDYFTIKKYGYSSSKGFTFSTMESFKPLKTPSFDIGFPNKYSSWQGWIPAGILYDLMDDTPNEIIRTEKDNRGNTTYYKDKASGFTIKQFFDALDSDVTSPELFRNRLLQETKNRQKDEVHELFKAYYWDNRNNR